MTAFALILFLGAAGAFLAARNAPPCARAYLRLAAVLYAAMSLGQGFAIAPSAVTDIAATLGAAVLAMAAYAACRRAPPVAVASLVLFIAALCGIGAAAMDWRAMAAAPQIAAAMTIAAVARRHLAQRAGLTFVLAAISLLGAAAAALVPGMAARAGVLLFAAAGVLGVAVASDLLVENGGARGRGRAIGGGS